MEKREPDKETLDCLVIGNSISYYNNLPEMVERITEAGTGKKVSVNSIVYTARQADEHGEAIHAALRTQGRSEALTEEEAKLFRYRENLSEEGEYRKEVFDEYAKALLDKGKVMQYDYLIIQDHGRDQGGSGAIGRGVRRSIWFTVWGNTDGTDSERLLKHLIRIKP